MARASWFDETTDYPIIHDQVQKLQALGLSAERIHSGRDRAASREACQRYLAGELDFLFIAPERLGVPHFPELLARRPPTLVAIDEAHCISQWGHDFRPDYRRIRDLIGLLPSTGPRAVPVLATTDTANARVVGDVVEQLGVASEQDVFVLRGPLARASLRLGVLRMPSPAARPDSTSAASMGLRMPVSKAALRCAQRSTSALAWPCPSTAVSSVSVPVVRVPVLSAQRTSTRPSASTARASRTMTPRPASRREAACWAAVTRRGSPSGTAATARTPSTAVRA